MESQGTNLKIFVVYHKPNYLLKNDIYQPIHAGRAIARTASKDGVINEQEYQWLLNNTIGDDTGDNISEKNRIYCEMTPVYWVWKNYLKQNKNIDFIGLAHYRRLLLLNNDNYKEERIYWEQITEANLNKYCIPPVKKIPTDIKVIAPKSYKVEDTLYNLFKREHFFHKDDIDKIYEITCKKYPVYKEIFNDYLNQRAGYFSNIFIMRRDIFEEYCEMSFDILGEFEKYCIETKDINLKSRFPAYMSEFMSGLIIHKTQAEDKNKVIKSTPVYIRDPEINLELIPEPTAVPIVINLEKTQINACMVMLSSIAKNADNTNMEVILLNKNFVQKDIKYFDVLRSNFPNLKIKFFNISKYIENYKKDDSEMEYDDIESWPLLYPEIFKNYQKIININIPAIINENLVNLYNIDLEDNYIGACLDTAIIQKVRKDTNLFNYITRHINSEQVFDNFLDPNLCIYNIEKINADKVQNKIFEEYEKDKEDLGYLQTFNTVFKDKTKILAPDWNVYSENNFYRLTNFHDDLLKKAQQNPKIIFYNKKNVPWANPDQNFSEYWFRYARDTHLYEQVVYRSIELKYLNEIKKLQKENSQMKQDLQAIYKLLKLEKDNNGNLKTSAGFQSLYKAYKANQSSDKKSIFNNFFSFGLTNFLKKKI